MAGDRPITKKLPCFAELPEEKKTLDALREMFRKPPVLYMQLEDLKEERRKIRGVYELILPTIDTELALQNGRSSTQYLTRDPDWLESHHPYEPIYLIEMTPVSSDPGLKERVRYANIRWQIVVIGEYEHKERRFQEHAQLARSWRAG